DKPAVALAERFLLLPSTIAEKETPTGLSGVTTFTKRIVGACASVAAAASLMYGPSRLTAHMTLPRGKLMFVLLNSYEFIAFTARVVPSTMPLGCELIADAPAR